MNIPSQTTAPAAIVRRHLRVLGTLFLQLAVSFNIFALVAPLFGQGETSRNDTIYIPERSAEDRYKFVRKSPIKKASPLPSIAPPANDNFANASLLTGSGTSGSILGSNGGATGEPGEPIHGAGGGDIGANQNSVWYRFTASSTGVITISTHAGTFGPLADSVMSAYTGTSVGTLTPVAENDDYPGLGFHSRITFATTAGQTYHVAVDGFLSAVGTFEISYAYSNAAGNDMFSNAEVISGISSPFIGITGATVGASGETGEPLHSGPTGSLNSIWYTWTAPANVSMTFTTAGSNFDTTLSVYTGSAVNTLALIARDDNAGPGNTSRTTFIANAGTVYRIALEGISSETGNTLLNWAINRAESGRQFDFDGDLKTDFSVYRPSNNAWYVLKSSSNSAFITQWGLGGDVLLPGDFEGDDRVDIGVWRPSTGIFYAQISSNGTLLANQWGLTGDVPVQGDFDGDDKSDVAIWRPTNGSFYVLRSSDSVVSGRQWGQNGDRPASGDYDGDGRTDLAVWRPSNGTFYIVRSFGNSFQFTNWGVNGDLVVPGDYDSDGKNDIAVYRPSTNIFYARRSSDGGLFAVKWGISGDLFAPGDYDGNGYSDVCVWRPSTGTFYVLRNPFSSAQFVQWGQNGDSPVSNSNVH